MRTLKIHLSALPLLVAVCAAQNIGNHKAVYDAQGTLLPWTSWQDALDREMKWYLNCPIEHGYPRFVYTTFMDGDYNAIQRQPDFIPATQLGLGIISYLKYHAYTKKQNPRVLEFARYMGDYLVKEALTPDSGKYPRFTRSTGWRAKFPQPEDCGSQGDGPYEIEPDKGGIAGYALFLLYEETKDKKYLQQALQNARVLLTNMGHADDSHTPWPFRADYRTGAARGPVSGNMTYIARLWDKLIEAGYNEFTAPRDHLWDWIVDRQIGSLGKDGALWVQFFEDHQELDNRTAWAPLNLARYLIEKKEVLDPNWQGHAKALIDFVIGHFTVVRNGVLICGEQDYDKEPWGGIASSFGAVLAMYSAATGSAEYKGLAYQNLNYVLYAINDDGCPRENALRPGRGGWQEDAHTDKIHNFMDAIAAFPEWAK
jgi:hypothetical protein